MHARSVRHSIRLVTVTMLALLLALAPFVHGHLGQPVQQGWHLHAGPLEVGRGGSASPAYAGAQGSGKNLSLLLAHESAAVEVSVGPSTLRVLRIASAHAPAPAPEPWLHADPAHALAWARHMAAERVGRAEPQPSPASRGAAGLPPPGHAPPMLLA